jgi:hypothetical protein
MATENTGNDQACTLDTEHTLATITDAGTYVLAVDLNPLVAGDVLILRLYTKARTGSTERLAYQRTFGPIVPGEKNVYSVPVPSPFSFKATMEQTDGTGRTFTWSVYEL